MALTMAACYILLLVSLIGLFTSITASPAKYSQGTEDQNDGSSHSNTVLLSGIAIATTLCFVLLVFGCACCFRKGFAKFEETTTTETVVGSRYTNFNDFSPPTESTPSFPPGLEPDTVTIEPLPDLSSRLGTSPGSISQSSWLKAGDSNPPGTEKGDINLINNPRFQFPRSQLSYVEEMGTGWFGKVLQGEAHRLHAGLRKTRVVIKQLRDTTTAEEQVLFLQEVQPYREVNHPNVLLLLGQCIESMPFLLILEYAPFGDLKSYLQKHQDMVQDMAHRDVQLRMACDMVSGMMWLHQADFIHIDLAARNCLVCSDTSVKIGDYGLSLEKYPDDYYITKDQHHAVPIRWLGPEVMEITDTDMIPRKVTKESNVWSFGVIMLELSTGGQKPYPNMTNEEVLKQVVMEQEIRLDKPNLDVRYASRWFEIMMFCWLESDMRPSMNEIHELLIHLRTNRDRVEMDDFQHRWDALKPAAMQESSESSKDDSLLSETKEDTAPTDGLTSGIANGYVSSPHGDTDTSPNVNMNANVDITPVMDAEGDFHKTPLGDIMKSNTEEDKDSDAPSISKELDFVIQPTVAEPTESAPDISNLIHPRVAESTESAPVISNVNPSDDLDFDPFVQPSDQDDFGGFTGSIASPVPVPAPTNIPEVLISSPTSPPAMDDDNLVFEEEVTSVESSEVQAAAPSPVATFAAVGEDNAASSPVDTNAAVPSAVNTPDAGAVDTSTAIDEDKEVIPTHSEETDTTPTLSDDKEDMTPSQIEYKQETTPSYDVRDKYSNNTDDKDASVNDDKVDEDDDNKTPSNIIDEPLFDFDTQATTSPRAAMETPEENDGPLTSTPSRTDDDLLTGGELPMDDNLPTDGNLPTDVVNSDDDSSSLSFISATSFQQKSNDGDSSSYNTMVTAQSDDPSFYSFSSPASSRNDSLQFSTDGSFKTLTDGSDDQDSDDDIDEPTFVDQTPETSDVLEDDISDGDLTPSTPHQDFLSLSGNVILQHELPLDTTPTLSSLQDTTLTADNLFNQSKTDTTGAQQQSTLQISQKSKKGGLSIKVASKKVTHTEVKHVRHVQQSSDGVQLYKKGDDYSVVQEVKGSPNLSGEFSQLLGQSGEVSKISSTTKEFKNGGTKETITETHRLVGQMESHRTVTVVQNVSSSSAKQERIIDLMLSGPPKQVDPSGSQEEQLVDFFSTPADNKGDSRILQTSQKEQLVDFFSASGEDTGDSRILQTSQKEQLVDFFSTPGEDTGNSSLLKTSQKEQLVDLFSTPGEDTGNNNISQAPLLQQTYIQPSAFNAPSNTPLIPDLMGDSLPMSTGQSSSGESFLIPDLLGGDTPVNVEQTMSVTSDGGGGLSWQQDMTMEGGGNFTTGDEGQSTKGQWSASTTVHQEHSVASSTDFGLPDFTFTVNTPQSQQPASETNTQGVIDFDVDTTLVGNPDQSANNTE